MRAHKTNGWNETGLKIHGYAAATRGWRAPGCTFDLVYRSALQGSNCGCYGFLLGTREDFNQPVFDLALVVRETKSGELFNPAPVRLEASLVASRQVAVQAETKVLGLFVAWDNSRLGNCRHEQFGIVIDTAKRLGLPFVAEFPTEGYETIWGLHIYAANRFPHEPLPYQMHPRRSRRAEHNPRRMLQLWKSLIK